MKDINRQILRLAIPNIITNISIPILGLVDTAIMGHLDSPVYIGAIVLGSMVFNFVYWGLGFLRMRTTGMTAQAFGSNDRKKQAYIFKTGIFVALSIATIILVLSIPLAWLGFHFVKGTPQVVELAKNYFFIRILGAPATLIQLVLIGWFLGMQNFPWQL